MRLNLGSILVASDLAQGSDDAVAAAGILAQRTGAALRLLHVIDLRANGTTQGGVNGAAVRRRVQDAQFRLEEQVRRAVPPDARVGDRKVVVGSPSRAIAFEAEVNAVDLVVMGPHHDHPFGDVLLGATADRVIRGVHVPILVLRRPLRLPIRRAAVPLAPGEPSRAALDIALRWIAALGPPPSDFPLPEVRLVHVVDEPDEPFLDHPGTPDALDSPDASGAPPVSIRTEVIRGGDAAHEIVDYAAAEEIDLVVVGTHGYGPLRRTLVGSVGSFTARQATCSVLLVPQCLWRTEVAATAAAATPSARR